MTIQDWGAIGELVGAFAVLATLIYLSLQIKQSSKTQRAQTHQQMSSDRATNLRLIIENPELRTAIAKAAAGESLTEDEQTIVKQRSSYLQ